MKPALLFLIKFLALTVPLVWLWQVAGLRIYHAFYSPIATAIYEALGYEGIATPARDRYVNFVPFLTLMLLTPGLSRRRRWIGIAVGIVALFAIHVWANFTANPDTMRLRMTVTIVLDGAPFFLWAAIAREFIRDLIRGASAPD